MIYVFLVISIHLTIISKGADRLPMFFLCVGGVGGGVPEKQYVLY